MKKNKSKVQSSGKTDCVFCKIVAGELPSKLVYEDDDYVVFNDINPKAPVHVLIVPRKHVDSVNQIEADQVEWAGGMFIVAKAVAMKLGIDKGYQLKIHTGKEGGQEVFHWHTHLLGGWNKK